MGGLDDDEQLVAIDFDFGHLFAIEGIFYRQRMEIEHRLEACHFIGCRVGNADPGKFAVGLLERVARQGEFFGALAEPIDVRGYNCHEGRSLMAMACDVAPSYSRGKRATQSLNARTVSIGRHQPLCYCIEAGKHCCKSEVR